MFDIDKFLTSSPIAVNATAIRFQDARTGEVFTRTIYRPGRCVTFLKLAEELAHYGFILQWVDDERSDIPGRIDWSEMFGKFIQQEGE